MIIAAIILGIIGVAASGFAIYKGRQSGNLVKGLAGIALLLCFIGLIVGATDSSKTSDGQAIAGLIVVCLGLLPAIGAVAMAMKGGSPKDTDDNMSDVATVAERKID